MTNSFRSRERERGLAFATRQSASCASAWSALLRDDADRGTKSGVAAGDAAGLGLHAGHRRRGDLWTTTCCSATEGSESASDFLTAMSPRAALGFRGRRSTFQLDYSRLLSALSGAVGAQRVRSAAERELPPAADAAGVASSRGTACRDRRRPTKSTSRASSSAVRAS